MRWPAIEPLPSKVAPPGKRFHAHPEIVGGLPRSQPDNRTELIENRSSRVGVAVYVVPYASSGGMQFPFEQTSNVDRPRGVATPARRRRRNQSFRDLLG